MIAMHRCAIGAAGCALLLLTTGCSDSSGTPPDDNGPVRVALATPSADDGALLITITGPGLTAIEPASPSYAVFWSAVNENETRVIVVGDIVDGPIFTATAPEGVAASEFAAGVMEIASRTDALRASLAGYSLSVAR
jgi:hypothetical protein